MTEQTGPSTAHERLALLDHSLLFLSSFLGFFFGAVIIYINPAGGTALSSLAVFVVVTAVLPLYVGVIRGGIESGSFLRERMRGWVYLLFGGGLFVFYLVVHTQGGPPADLASGLLALLDLPVLIVVTWFSVRFTRWGYKTFLNSEPSGVDLTALYGSMGGIFFSMLFFIAVALQGAGFNTFPITDPFEGDVLVIAESFIFLLPLLFIEFNCHHPILLEEAATGSQKYLAANVNRKVTPNDSWLVRASFVVIDMTFRTMFMLKAGINRNSSFAIRIVVYLLGLFIAYYVATTYFYLGLAIIIVLDVLFYYEFWGHMKRTWKREAVVPSGPNG